jgi:glycosyltransferase involved in cell wall biosynthesis
MENKKGRLPQVIFFQRKPRPVGNYSVEFIFEDVRKRLKDAIDSRVVISAYESNGLWKRFYNCIQAFLKQGKVNHVTGDVNYLGLLLNREKTIQTVLDCVHLNTSSGIKYKILRLFWLVIPERRSRFITAISESTKKEILKHHSCNPNKIVVIPVAISPKFKFSEKKFNKNTPRILQVGTAANKNIPNLILALKGIPCILHIVGKKNEAYEILLKDNKVDYIYEWGLSEEDMIQRYEDADIITLISTYEGFGMPILEGQAIGRPVITSNQFSMPEVAGDAAVIVDPLNIEQISSGFKKIINDDDFRDEMISRGLKNIKRFDAEVIAREYLKLYEKIAAE